jgi:uncharacterized membrane protein YeaQ/YmgE (transglycosylase-associated protein family)
MGGILVVVVILLIAYVAISASIGIINLLISLLIWAVIGWLAGQLIRGRGYGAVINILLGIGGGIIGSILFSLLGLGVGGGVIGNILAGVVGAVILILAGRALRSQNPG